jgi:Family of unknown function (DUF6111)
MIRAIVTEVGLFLTPFVLYAVFLAITNTSVLQAKSWRASRLAALLIVSLLLMFGSFLILAQFSGAPPGSTYVPAHVENGKFVPGTSR